MAETTWAKKRQKVIKHLADTTNHVGEYLDRLVEADMKNMPRYENPFPPNWIPKETQEPDVTVPNGRDTRENKVLRRKKNNNNGRGRKTTGSQTEITGPITKRGDMPTLDDMTQWTVRRLKGHLRQAKLADYGTKPDLALRLWMFFTKNTHTMTEMLETHARELNKAREEGREDLYKYI